MAITRTARPQSRHTADAVFVSEAPDAQRVQRWQRGAKTQITVTIDPVLLDLIDAEARRLGLNRTALLTGWANEKLNRTS